LKDLSALHLRIFNSTRDGDKKTLNLLQVEKAGLKKEIPGKVDYSFRLKGNEN
jgi:hypothetical protein